MKGLCAIFAALFAFGVGAAFAADEWGIEHEEVARIEATVVDILCELTGDCPAGCGAGKRQLGLLQDDGTLLLAAKNFDAFAGAANDLISFCGKRIVADGLLIRDPAMPLFALQFKRLAPDGEWSRANWFSKDWGERYGADKASEWFRHDPAVKGVIAKDGVFGIPGLKPEE
ncbi:MAG TPA: hypothetical protein QF804_08850 [Rhodospirillales bacterium]|jgi:hypothetical protein|nr:hypothetical protein [Rhodospirillales bacterium]HJO69776.1 hypothetical protein [Rhodospirillales bacterium]